MQQRGCLRLIAFLCGGSLLFCVISVIAIQLQRSAWIAPFETRFASNLQALPATPSVDILMPARVGGFQRVSFDTQAQEPNYAYLMSAGYTSPEASYQLQIFVSRLPSPFDKVQFFQPSKLGPDNIGGWEYVNVNALVPFRYGSAITFSDQFVGVTWINGDYSISLSGDRQSIIEFLSHYPY